VQTSMRRKAFEIGKHFSAAGVCDWIWQSTERGWPMDDRYEALMPTLPQQFAYYVEPPVPPQIREDFVPVFQALRRLRVSGYMPDFVIDIGSSTGIWSHTICTLFLGARFILIDPLASRYPELSKSKFNGHGANVEVVEAAVADCPGRVMLQVSADLYNSSLIHIDSATAITETIDVQAITLDALAQRLGLNGRGLVKISGQFAEHLIIEGGARLLTEQVDVLIVELTLERVHATSKTLLEMLNRLDDLGFRYADDVGTWRSPVNGRLQQKDALFVRKEFDFGKKRCSFQNPAEPFLGTSK
jgi:FkbM family methyltransferase